MNKAKPFKISKDMVLEAYKKVKANRGGSGVDKQSLEDFKINLKNNLYKIWNRMSSGSYFPPPVLEVEIPKKGKGVRKLGIPTVSDRIAQMVVKLYLEPILEPIFLKDSFGYRPGKSALDAVRVARERCWKQDWVIDLDIKGFFDNLNHELLMKAVRKHTDCKWILLYIERWLKAPIKKAKGLESRSQGTPQGGVISPLLANLFLHYAFDRWIKQNFPEYLFERYADDIIVHCRTEEEAKEMRKIIEERLLQCCLKAHPEKTKIVYCKDGIRTESYENEKFDFLGYTFRPRRVRTRRGVCFTGFNPGVSNLAKKKMKQTMRKWKIHLRSPMTILQLAKWMNPVLRGWINYYGKFYITALRPILCHINESLARWAKRKYKRFRRHFRKAINWLGKIAKENPKLFAHWICNVKPAAK